MSRGLNGYRTDYGVGRVAVDGSGNGSLAVTFSESFQGSPPSVHVVPGSADSGTRAATTITTTGFTITVNASNIVNGYVRVYWFAHELTA